ncbi:MAG: asparaginase [Chloroflexaceae bacterium]|nr:asparaginase [Chloroflexaceae bacterium]
MKRIVVLTTGVGIIVKQSPMVGGSIPSLKGDDFMALMPREGVDLVFEEVGNRPGSHLTPTNALELSHYIESILLDPAVSGVVVTHGTDTLEETAYLLDLTIQSPKPVIVTGAMRPTNHQGYDGIINLTDAIRLAASDKAGNMGVLVLLNHEIHAASQVQCLYAQALQAFQSPESGPLGRIMMDQIRWYQRPLNRQYIPCARLEPMVELVRLTQGTDDRLLRCLNGLGLAGLVLEVFGSGRVPPWWLPAISEAIAQRTAIAITSRCMVGGLGDEYGYVGAYHDLRRSGVLLVSNLNGMKTRIKLMVALGAARNNEELHRWFQT